MKIDGLKIEIFKENELVDTRVIPAKGDRGEMRLYSQVAYAHLGGKFPVEMSLPLEEGQPYYTSGMYFIHASSFKVGNYGRLEFDRNIKLIPES